MGLAEYVELGDSGSGVSILGYFMSAGLWLDEQCCWWRYSVTLLSCHS